jgi:hypothetical protein
MVPARYLGSHAGSRLKDRAMPLIKIDGCNCKLGAVDPLSSPIVRRQRAYIARMRGFGAAPRMISIRAMPKPLGRLGASWFTSAPAQEIGQTAASWGASVGAGAAAGSVVPGIGTAVGAVVGIAVGYLSSKLFGHANQGQILDDITTRMKYADAYKGIAGQIPGRVIGIHDLLFVTYGLLAEGYYPQNTARNVGVLHNQLCPPQYPKCGSGSEQWIQALFQKTNGDDLLNDLIKKANNAGVTNPITIADQYVIPAWQSSAGKGTHDQSWAAPANTPNASLMRQLIIDWVDATEAQSNANLPVYYGQIPGSTSAGAPAAPAPAPVTGGQIIVPRTSPILPTVAAPATPAAAPAPVPVTPTAAPAPTVPTASLSPNGAMIAAGVAGAALLTAQGSWNLSGNTPTLNGSQTSAPVPFSQLAILNGQPVGLGTDGSTWGWNGSTWQQLGAANQQLAQQAQMPSPAMPTYAPAYSSLDTSSGGLNPVDLGGAPAAAAPPGTVAAAATNVPLTMMSPTVLLGVGAVGVVAVIMMAKKGKRGSRRG